MSKIKFVAIFVPDQSHSTGEVAINHANRKLGSSVFFSDKFDLGVESQLKDSINSVRNEIFQPILNEYNADLPEGMKEYVLGKPKTISNLHEVRGQITIPVEFSLEIDNERLAELKSNGENTSYNPIFTEGSVISYKIFESCMCNHPRAYGTWKHCEFGNKREFFKQIEDMKRHARNTSDHQNDDTAEQTAVNS